MFFYGETSQRPGEPVIAGMRLGKGRKTEGRRKKRLASSEAATERPWRAISHQAYWCRQVSACKLTPECTRGHAHKTGSASRRHCQAWATGMCQSLPRQALPWVHPHQTLPFLPHTSRRAAETYLLASAARQRPAGSQSNHRSWPRDQFVASDTEVCRVPSGDHTHRNHRLPRDVGGRQEGRRNGGGLVMFREGRTGT